MRSQCTADASTASWKLALFATLVVAMLATPLLAHAAQDRYQQARELALSGDHEAARELLLSLLQERPEHWDARVLLGRLYAWDKRFDEAREQLLIVVRAKPNYTDAISALVDVEMWSHHWERALEVVNQGLNNKPTHEGLLYKKAVVQKNLGDLTGASVTLDRLYDVNPAHPQGTRLYRQLRVSRARHKIGLRYGYTDLDTVSNPWHTGSFELTNRTGIGSIVARVNYANRFRQSATQYEIDAYPKIANGVYLFVNYGYSADRLYPQHRYAAELYTNLPHGIEISAGFRKLHFADSRVTIYTGTLAKYQGNWWFSFRPYITPKTLGTSRSYQMTIRRYFGNADNYLGVFGGVGSSPGEVRDITDLVRRDSWRIGAELDKTLGDLFILKLSGRYRWEELGGGLQRRRFTVGLGFERRF